MRGFRMADRWQCFVLLFGGSLVVCGDGWCSLDFVSGGRVSTRERGTTGLGAEMNSSYVALCNLVSA